MLESAVFRESSSGNVSGSGPGSVLESATGSVPGSVPGSVSGSVPESVPASVPQSVPGSVVDRELADPLADGLGGNLEPPLVSLGLRFLAGEHSGCCGLSPILLVRAESGWDLTVSPAPSSQPV